jgi:hypothetical protein
MKAATPAMKATAFADRWASAGQAGLGQVRVGPSGSAQTGRKDSFLFSEIISGAKTGTVKPSKCLQGTKNTQKILKIPGKFSEID